MTGPIRLADARVSEEGVAAVADVLRSGQLISGRRVAAFEESLAAHVGSREAVAVSSGTAALHLALLALDIGPGDAVVVPDFTFPATANAVAMTGARPVVVDVDPGTYTMAPEAVSELIDRWQGPERLRALMPVHEFGRCADMAALTPLARDAGMALIEDAACALGATCEGGAAGALGDVGCFSFHPRKSVTTGEGGALTTDDPSLAERLRRLRNHGMERTSAGVAFREVGLNYRLTEFQGALGEVALAGLPEAVRARRAVAAAYDSALSPDRTVGVAALPVPVEGHAWQTYMVVLDPAIDRARVIAELADAGVEANLGAQSLSDVGLYGRTGATVGPMLARHGLALPCHQGLSADDVDTVLVALRAVLDGAR